jgi:hypothetical protein
MKKKAKVINTEKPVSDETFPTFPPYRNSRAPSSATKNILEMVVHALVQLSKSPASPQGISTIQIKSFIKKEFQKDMAHPRFRGRFAQAVSQGLESGQLVKTSLGVGATGTGTVSVLVLVWKAAALAGNSYAW